MIGPTGVGKTEIVRRVAKLVDAPFIRVEATAFTEVGYHGKVRLRFLWTPPEPWKGRRYHREGSVGGGHLQRAHQAEAPGRSGDLAARLPDAAAQTDAQPASTEALEEKILDALLGPHFRCVRACVHRRCVPTTSAGAQGQGRTQHVSRAAACGQA